jgi:hypothetical protein
MSEILSRPQERCTSSSHHGEQGGRACWQSPWIRRCDGSGGWPILLGLQVWSLFLFLLRILLLLLLLLVRHHRCRVHRVDVQVTAQCQCRGSASHREEKGGGAAAEGGQPHRDPGVAGTSSR